MKSTAYAVLAIILATGILQTQAAKKPKKFCRGDDGIKYKPNEGYKEGCTQFMCVKKGKKIKMTSKPIPNCGTTTTPAVPQPPTTTPPPLGPEDNVNVTALQMNVDSLNATVETLQATVQALLSVVTKQGTCMSDFMSSDCPATTPGKISLVDRISSNTDGISSNTHGISSNKGEINVNKADVSSNKAGIVSNTATYSSIQAATTNLETCLADVNSAKCPSSKDGKTSVPDAIMKNTDDVEFHHTDCSVGEEYAGNCYLLVETAKTWLDAQADCNGRNGNLASIDNLEANNFLANLAGGSKAWIGASDVETEGSWKWTNGDDVLFTNWHTGQPDNLDGNQNCGLINFGDAGKWDDGSCINTRKFICQGNQLSNVTSESRQWSGIQANIWNDDQCKNIGKGSSSGLEDCKKSCLETATCTAINYNIVTKNCILRGCTQPVPSPQWQLDDYTGYYILDQTASCPAGWTTLTTGCYKLTNAGTHQQAIENCRKDGGYLVEIDSQEENNALSVYFKEGAWLGATDIKKDGEWVWSHSGKQVSFTNWQGGEPNGGTSANCLQFTLIHTGQWNDHPCDRSYKGVCELDTGATCDVSNWPDLDHGLVCGSCKALINHMSSKYITCDSYCDTIGRGCSGAWEEVDDNCQVQSTETCSHKFTYTTDAICACGPLKAESRQWSGIQDKIWDDDQCKNIGKGSSSGLEDCKKSCLETATCTAINYNIVTKNCILRGCTQPVPSPQWQLDDYTGYYILDQTGHNNTGALYLDGGYWGVWGSSEYCPFPHFAHKMELKIESNQGGGDDSALNAIRLTCTNGQTITSDQSEWGNWTGVKSCSSNNYIKGATIRKEANQGSGDDSAANGVRFICTDGQQHHPGDGYWGEWQTWETCPSSSVVYGLQTQIEGNQGGGDDSALNDVKLFCAKLPVSGCKMENINFPGNDIPGGISTQQNWQSCQNKCQTNPNCTHWSFRNSDGNCWLKTGNEAQSEENGLVSGPRDCSDCTNGMMTTTMTIEGRDVEVRCENGENMTQAWTVIQRRGQYNNTEDYFYKNFSEYENVFGSVDVELWIGLKNLAALTKDGSWELQVDLTDWDDKVYHAKYGKFSVGPPPTYQLHVQDFDDENSTLGDSLAYHSGSNFSTYDVDNDIDSRNCAEKAVGAWWFKNCYNSNLNGENFASQHMESWRGIDWELGKARGNSYRSWKASVMKIRKFNGH